MAYLLTIYEDNATINTNYVGPNSQLFLINIHGLGIGFRDASFLFAGKIEGSGVDYQDIVYQFVSLSLSTLMDVCSLHFAILFTVYSDWHFIACPLAYRPTGCHRPGI